VGIRNVVIDLEQVPLGADDINPQPAVRFNFNIDCRLPLVPVGGIAEEPDVTALPTVTSSSGRDYATYIAGSAAGIIMLAVGGGWVLRRRRA
jgi:hypothetical protein